MQRLTIFRRSLFLVLLIILWTLPAAHAATSLIYDDALATGWANWSWAQVDLAASNPIHSGSHSLAVTYSAAWQGLYLAYPAGFDTTPYTRLRFYLHGGGNGDQQIQLYAVLPGDMNGPAVTLPAPAAGSWTEVEVPLVDLGVSANTLTGLIWQDSSGGPQPTFYLDDLAFIDDAHPDGPVFEAVTMQRSALPADGRSGLVIKAQLSDPQGLGDLAAVTLDGGPLGRSETPLLDDGRHNDGSAGDGLFGVVVTAAPNTPVGEQMLTLTARDLAGHSSTARAGALVILAPPGGIHPSDLPDRPAWGTNQWSETAGADWQVNSGVAWDYIYQYITYSWYTDGWGGNFVGRFVQQAWDKDYIPVISVYLMLGLPPECGENAACYAQKLQNEDAVGNYLAAIVEAADQAKGNQPVIFHLEPDFYGFMQQYNYQQGVPQPDSPANYPVALNVAGYPNDLRGFGRRIVDLIHQTAPNALVAPHASMWATNIEPHNVSATDVALLAQATVTFIDAMGGTESDLYFVEWSDRDSGCTDLSECQPPRPWWDVDNRSLPRASRAVQWENALSVAAGKRLLLWQVPSGNMDLDDTCLHYRDNRPAYAFSRPRDLFEAGVIAILFGGGAACSTQPSTDGGFIQAQGAIAYAPPAAPTGLAASPPTGPIVPLDWRENDEPDLWGYRLSYRPVAGGPTYSVDVGIGNATGLLLPAAGTWQVNLAAYDAMGQLSPAGSPLLVTTTVGGQPVYLPLVVR